MKLTVLIWLLILQAEYLWLQWVVSRGQLMTGIVGNMLEVIQDCSGLYQSNWIL